MSLDHLRALCMQIDSEPIAERALRMVELWTPPGAEGPIAQLVADELRTVGADEVRLDEEFPGSPSVLAVLQGEEPGPTLQWHGHLDAIDVPHAPPYRKGDTIYGRGTSDMKGAIAAMVESVRLLRAAGYPRRGTILVTYHGMHEAGGSAPLHRLIERGIVGDAVMIGELGSGCQLITGSRGLTFWDVVVTREGGPIHETNRAPETIDPLDVGHRLLDRFCRLRDRLISGEATPAGSLFIGKMTAGDYNNRVPGSCEIAGTRRHHADSSLDAVRDQLLQLVEEVRRETGARIETHVHGYVNAYSIDPDEPVAQALRHAYHDLTGEAMVPVTSRAAGNAADFVAEAGIPVVYYGCDYATAHSDCEQLSIAELGHVAGIYALAAAYFLDGGYGREVPPLGGEG